MINIFPSLLLIGVAAVGASACAVGGAARGGIFCHARQNAC